MPSSSEEVNPSRQPSPSNGPPSPLLHPNAGRTTGSGSFSSQRSLVSQYSHMRKPSPKRILVSGMYPGNSGAEGGYREAKPGPEDNIPSRFELFLLGDGEKKVTEEPDTRIPSSSIFTFNKEDHTLGNMLRSRLLQSQHVTFAGYKVPHPLFSNFILRVQTDGTLTPRAVLIQSCRDLVNDLSLLSREFTKEWELRKMAGAGPGEANGVEK